MLEIPGNKAGFGKANPTMIEDQMADPEAAIIGSATVASGAARLRATRCMIGVSENCCARGLLSVPLGPIIFDGYEEG